MVSRPHLAVRLGAVPMAGAYLWLAASEPVDLGTAVMVGVAVAVVVTAARSRIAVVGGHITQTRLRGTSRAPLAAIVGIDVARLSLPFGSVTATFLVGLDAEAFERNLDDLRRVALTPADEPLPEWELADHLDPDVVDDDAEPDKPRVVQITFSPVAWRAGRDIVAMVDATAARNRVPIDEAADAELARWLGRQPRPDDERYRSPKRWVARQRRAGTAPPRARWTLVAAWVTVVAVLFFPVSAASSEPAYPWWFAALMWAVLLGLVVCPLILALGWPNAVRLSWAVSAIGVVVGLADFAYDTGVAAAETAAFLLLCGAHGLVWSSLTEAERLKA